VGMEDGEHKRRADVSARTSELRASAAAKGAELRESAAAKAEELRNSAAAKGGDLRSSAVAKGGDLAARSSDLGRTAALRSAEVRGRMRQLDVPWARCRPARMARETILQFVLGPLMGVYTRARVHGRECFDELPPPVVLAANHSSHLDTPTILRALPLKWRQRTAVAAAADYFYNNRAVANLVALIFNTVPIARRGGGVGNGSFDHVDRLIDQRWNLLIFPEGTRSRDGELGRLRSGAAVIAHQHRIPIVPVRVRGTHDAMPPGRNWPKRIHGFLSRRHRVEVTFGPPIWAGDDDDRAAVMSRVRAYLNDEDIDTGAVEDDPADAAVAQVGESAPTERAVAPAPPAKIVAPSSIEKRTSSVPR
jgi:1-acyl-sn-glycerol-3-phosphate acyltransferase